MSQKLYDTGYQKPKAILIDVIDPQTTKSEALKRLEEVESLVDTYGGVVVVKTIQKKGLPNYKTYVGKGKIDEVFQIAKEQGVSLIIVNNLLKPSQSFNLNEIFRKIHAEVWDRIDLILKIFEKHAVSTHAKLQVELASIKHMGPRIYGLGKELGLSQQRGARGSVAGRGETNIEVMKRHLRRQEDSIMEKLEHYELIKSGHRQRRKKSSLKTVAIVGYTNTGKTSLLNALTKKGSYAANELFATLDTSVGKLYIPPDTKVENQTQNYEYVPGKQILISDTIGFIRDLPPSLIEAFKSTLAETIESDMILHVIDIADKNVVKKIEIVEEILNDLGVGDKPKIYVFNKIDLLKLPPVTENEIEIPKTDFTKTRPPSLIKAGKHVSRILGWEEVDSKRKEHYSNLPEKFAKKYKKFNPVFISADKKINLNAVIDKIKEII